MCCASRPRMKRGFPPDNLHARPLSWGRSAAAAQSSTVTNSTLTGERFLPRLLFGTISRGRALSRETPRLRGWGERTRTARCHLDDLCCCSSRAKRLKSYNFDEPERISPVISTLSRKRHLRVRVLSPQPRSRGEGSIGSCVRTRAPPKRRQPSGDIGDGGVADRAWAHIGRSCVLVRGLNYIERLLDGFGHRRRVMVNDDPFSVPQFVDE
jgi:hypothetical protein